MALEFALAVISGLVVALVSSFLQRRKKPPDTLLEVTRRTEAVVQSTTFVEGNIVQEDSRVFIEESTFRILPSDEVGQDPRLAVMAGVVMFALVLGLLLLMA